MLVCGAVFAHPSFEPDDARADQARLEDGAWVERGPGYAVRIKLLDDAGRRAWLRQAAGAEVDPFAVRPDQAPGHLSFLLELENRGQGPIVLEPQNCWLVTSRGEILNPIGIEGLRTAYGSSGLVMPPAYERAAPAVLEGSKLLGPGESAAGLLVYRTFKPKTNRFRVELQLVLPSGELLRMSAPYWRPRARKP